MGLVDVPFAIPHLRCENGEAPAHVRIGWFRSVSNIPHAFAVQSFVAELAQFVSLLGNVEDDIVDVFHKGGGVDRPPVAMAHDNSPSGPCQGRLLTGPMGRTYHGCHPDEGNPS
jgi:hypothetical protein